MHRKSITETGPQQRIQALPQPPAVKIPLARAFACGGGPVAALITPLGSIGPRAGVRAPVPTDE
jgi:hypothetical protein